MCEIQNNQSKYRKILEEMDIKWNGHLVVVITMQHSLIDLWEQRKFFMYRLL